MDLPGVGANHQDVEEMKPPPMRHRVLGSLPFLIDAAIAYLVARCCGWNPG